MNTTIYYFSGTGNCYYVAKRIAEQLKDTKIVPITYARRNNLMVCRSQRVGFVFPSYAYGLPKVVKEFVKDLCIMHSEYVFSVVTFGTRAGSVHSTLKGILKRKGINLNAGYYVRSVENFAPIFKMEEGEKVKDILDIVQRRTDSVVSSVSSLEINKIKAFNPIGKTINAIFNGVCKHSPKLFKVKGCVGCAKCVNSCPNGNISVKDGKLKFAKSCSLCTACIQVCPRKSITLLRANKKNPRYFNPNVDTAKMNKQIEVFE